MTVMKVRDIRKLDMKTLQAKLNEIELELAKEKANIYIGANATSPGKIREMKKTIARILTVIREKQRGENN